METKELISTLNIILSRQLDWIKSADSKSAFAFTLNTAMLALLAGIAPRSIECWTITTAIATSFSIFFALSSLLFISFSSFPRTQGPKGSLIFFGGITQRTNEQFMQATIKLTDEDLIKDLAEQCHRNAEIAAAKFKWIQRAMLCLYLAVVPWATALWLLYSVTYR